MVGFTDSVDRFYDMLQVGQVYTITKGQLKLANKARCAQSPSRASPASRRRLKQAHPARRHRLPLAR